MGHRGRAGNGRQVGQVQISRLRRDRDLHKNLAEKAPEVTGPEASRSPDPSALVPRLTHLSIPQYHELDRRQPLQPHRAPGMELVGADADLGSKPVLETVGEAG